MKAKYALLVITLLILQGCTSIPIPDKHFQSSSEKSLVSGHFEMNINGQIVPIKRVVLCVIPRTESISSLPLLSSMTLLSSMNYIEVLPDGYFFAALPPGKYKLYSISRGRNMKMCEGYEICDSRGERANIDFEVVSGRATYIGFIKFIVSISSNSDLRDWKIEDDFEVGKKTFASRFPTHTEPIGKLAIAGLGRTLSPSQARPEVYTILPVTVGLSSYKTLLLNVSSKFSKTSQVSGKKLEDELIKRLKENFIFENIISISSSKDPSAELRLNLEITEIRELKAKPFILVPGITKSGPGILIVLNGEFVDLRTGKNNGAFRVESPCFDLFSTCEIDFFELAIEHTVDFFIRNME